MGTNVPMGRTTVTELRERIRKLGGTPRGNTKAVLLDQLEDLMVGTGTGNVSQADIDKAVSKALADQLPGAVADAIQTGPLTETDMDDIFGDEVGPTELDGDPEEDGL